MKLEPGEIICDKCKGRGTIPKVDKPTGEIVTYIICRKCHGKKKVDWITNAMGERSCYYVKPGVYVKEVDLSEYIPSFNQVKTFEIKNINQKGE